MISTTQNSKLPFFVHYLTITESGLLFFFQIRQNFNHRSIDKSIVLNVGGYAAYVLAQMFEHMKNYQALFKKVSTWLRPTSRTETMNESDESLLFIHIFCHKTTPYHFVEDDGWMAKNFFSGINLLYPAKPGSSNLVTCRRDNAFP
jgi:hypothetical protein